MELKKHPEHALYQKQRALARRWREAVVEWREQDARAGEVELALGELNALLDVYNHILWQRFPYCGQCLGGCCVVGAADLKPIDYVALALLGEELPERPAWTGLDQRACIYLAPQGCSWPARWRPLKCALFYCLGSGAIALDASDARYVEITAALAATIAPRLSRLLPDEADNLLALLPDPVAFAGGLARVLEQMLLDPLYERQPALRPEPAAVPPVTNDALATAMGFIERATEQLWHNPPPPPLGSELTADQLLADLETVAWIVEGRPSHADRLLAELQERYPPAAPDNRPPSLWQEMAVHLSRLRST